jgi:polyisoprenoid-binding protein YceI
MTAAAVAAAAAAAATATAAAASAVTSAVVGAHRGYFCEESGSCPGHSRSVDTDGIRREACRCCG